MGRIPPLLIETESSGINFLIFISYSVPKPLHLSHIPLGELKEKVFGSGFGYEIPDSGHIKFLLKYSGFPESESKITKGNPNFSRTCKKGPANFNKKRSLWVSKTNFKDVENVLKESSVHFDELGLVIKDNFIFLSDDKISIDELAKHNKNWLMEYMVQ